MAPIHGRPFLEYQLDYWIEQGLDGFILAVGYKHEMISDHFGTAYKQIPIDYMIEARPMGTGGALLLAANTLKEERFIALNGDTYFQVPLRHLCDVHDQRRAELTMALREIRGNTRYNEVTLLEDGSISGFYRPSGTTDVARINGGVYLMERKMLLCFHSDKQAPLSFEDDVLPSLLERKRRCFGVSFSAKFVDIGIPSDYLDLAPEIICGAEEPRSPEP
jgi:D-glycero-alpha-D-manno-heptose 1-phosphate guanylyltransferase